MTNRLEQLKKEFQNKSINALIVSKSENIAYLSGFTGSSGTLLITPNQKYLLTDFRYFTQAKKQSPDFELVDFMKLGLFATIKDLLAKENINNVGFEAHYLTYNTVTDLKEVLGENNTVGVSELIEELRVYKDEEEVENIRQAEYIGDQAFTHILGFIKEGMTEREIALEIEFFMKKIGASNLSFDTIVASGPNSAMPHAKPTDRKIQKGDFLKMDYGCIYNGYCSDMTRTVVIGEASEKHKEIYNIVLEAQKRAIESIKPGMVCKEVDRIARDYITEKGYGEYFGHGLGHGVGRYIHESPRLFPKGEVVLQPGMVVTVEPGIYLPEFGGVRIEDVIAVTETGYKNLTTSPKELTVIA